MCVEVIVCLGLSCFARSPDEPCWYVADVANEGGYCAVEDSCAGGEGSFGVAVSVVFLRAVSTYLSVRFLNGRG